MSRTLTAFIITPAITYCCRDGTPYRADPSGLIHVEARHVAEMQTFSSVPGGATPILATAAAIGATYHHGAGLQITVENN